MGPVVDILSGAQINISSTHVGDFLDQHRDLYKVVVVINQIFRAVLMMTFMAVLPYSPVVNLSLSLAGSIFYLITIERKCAFHFAVPSCIGGAALQNRQALAVLVNGAAFRSLQTFKAAALAASPIALWLLAIVMIASHEVDRFFCQSCCSRPWYSKMFNG